LPTGRTAFFDAGDGSPIVFIHGLAANATYWLHVAPYFLSRGHRVVGLDLLGCGESDKPSEGYSVVTLARQTRQLMDVLGVERAMLVGHSLGGMVASRLVNECPERVGSLVLVNPGGCLPVPLPMRLAGHLLLRPRILEALMPHLWKAVLGAVFYEQNEHTRAFIEMVDATYDRDDVAEITRVIAVLRRDFLERTYLPDLHNGRARMWIIWGEKDRLVPARAFRRAAARNPHLCVEEIPGAGHMPIIERPGVVRRFIGRALRNQTR
jgi:pimeloyl-ACP methyl ester carboxylesterase